MINVNMFELLTFLLGFITAIITIIWSMENSLYHDRFIDFTHKWFLVLPVILAINCALIYDFYDRPTTTELICQVIDRENVSYIYFNGSWVNLNKRYNRNFHDEIVTVDYIDLSYRGWGNILYPSKGMIQEVR